MIGTNLGPFRIDRELGSGGMGTVYLAEVTGRSMGVEVGDRVALKVVHAHLLEQPGFFKRFMREAEVGRSITHGNVVRTLDVDATTKDGTSYHFLVMEYVEGQTLRELLEELGKVPEELCRHIAREMAKALSAIHGAGIVHRDIKPDNVLITEAEEIKVMDLGVARLADEVIRLSQTGAFVGSVLYAAPEQFRGGGDSTDGRADLYSLGLTLYELTTGQHPFADEDLRVAMRRQLEQEPRPAAELNPQLSPFFEEIVGTLLAKDREKRFATSEVLLATLDEAETSAWWQTRAKEIRAETHQPLRRVRVPRETVLCGRDDELAKVRALYDKAKAGEGQVLLIEGEAGIGKTRLVDELIGQLRQEREDLNFLFGTYPPGGAATAAGAFSTAYREHFGAEGLEDTLGKYLRESPLLVPAFAALLRGDPTPRGEEPLTKDSIQTVFVHATRALAAERPTVILIDDLHYAPEGGRAMIAALALALAEHRVLLVATAHPGLPDDWTASVERLDHATRIHLGRLSPKHLAGLLKDAFRSERLAQELGFQIAEKSDGNPLFVFEIIRGLREGKFITQANDGTWVSTQVINNIQIPSSVMDLIEARISDIDEEDRDLLDVASCAGVKFNPGHVADAVGMGRIPALKRLGRIEKRRRLIRASGREFVFDHNQVQEALYHALPEMLREEYHAALADALERKEGAADIDPKELEGQVAVDLCNQFLKGAEGKRAIRYLDAAVDHFEANYMGEAALDLVTRALAVRGLATGEGRVDLLLRQEKLLDPLGRSDEQRAALDEALPLAKNLDTCDREARVLVALGRYSSQVARYEEALEILSRAIDCARTAGDCGIDARAVGQRGSVYFSLGRNDEALADHERHLALAREIGDIREEANATGSLGGVFARLGRSDEARAHQERRLSLALKLRNRRDEARAKAGLGSLLSYMGHHEDARVHLEANLSLARQTGDRRAEANGTSTLGAEYWTVGRFEDARANIRLSLGLNSELGDRRGEAICLHNLGEMWTILGRHDLGREQMSASLEIARQIGYQLLLAVTPAELARASWQEGDETEAERLLTESLASFEEARARDFHAATAALYFGNLLMRTGRTDEARTRFAEALAIAREASAPGIEVLATCHLAALPGGDADAARETYLDRETRLEHFEKLEGRYLLWKATVDLAHLEEAHRLLMFVRDHGPDESRESVIENVPLHRDIVAAWKEHGNA